MELPVTHATCEGQWSCLPASTKICRDARQRLTTKEATAASAGHRNELRGGGDAARRQRRSGDGPECQTSVDSNWSSPEKTKPSVELETQIKR